MGESGNHDGCHIGVKKRQVFKQLQAIVAGPQVPVKNGEVDGMLIGLDQGGFGVCCRQDATIELGAVEPFAEGPAHRLFVFDNQDSFSRFTTGGHGRMFSPASPLGCYNRSVPASPVATPPSLKEREKSAGPKF